MGYFCSEFVTKTIIKSSNLVTLIGCVCVRERVCQQMFKKLQLINF